MGHNLRILLVSLVVSCVWATAVFAQGLEGLLLQPKQYGSVSYISGGVGLDERDAMTQVASEYNLKLSFALTAGNYVADVAVEIRDGGGRVALKAVSDGPWFFARLPSGSYTVEVRASDRTETKTAHVPATGQTVLNFYWENG